MKTSRLLVLVSVAIGLLVIFMAGASLVRQHDEALADAHQRLTALNLALSEQMERSLQAVDLSLADISASLQNAPVWTSAEVHGSLKAYAAAMPQIRAIAVVNASGTIVNDSALFPASPIQVEDREYFRTQLANPRQGMFVAEPHKSRRDKEWTVVLSRAVVDRHGNFQGVVFARLQPGYFQELYQRVLQMKAGAVTVFRRDGIQLLRQPHEEDMVGKNFSATLPLFSQLKQAGQGSFEAPAAVDGQRRLFSYSTLRAYPLILNVHQGKDEILAHWRSAATASILTLALALLAGFWLTRRLLRALHEQEQAADALRLGASVFEHTQEGILVTDAGQHIIEANRAFTRLSGYTIDELRGKNPSVMKSGRHDKFWYDAMWHSINTTGEWRGEIWNRRKNGELYPGILNINTVRNPAGKITHYVGVFSDISDLKLTQQNLENLANYDALTGLPNRTLLADRMQLAIAHARRQENLLAVCFLDLDGFKPVNDQHGHDIGDQLLIQVAQRLRNALRTEDTVARLGGDEFVLLLSDLRTVEECEAALARVIADLCAPCLIAQRHLQVSASIGVAIYPFDDAEPDMLLRLADHAMYRAKHEGRNQFRFYEADETETPG